MSQFCRAVLLAVLLLAIAGSAIAAGEVDRQRGEYLLQMGGCVSCHTEEGGEPLAGGVRLETPFGIFVTPNITPDSDTGIGGWSEEAFVRAMSEGIAPDGQHYYPAFPYTSYRQMTEQDLRDLKAYLDSVPAVRRELPAHDLSFPFNIRALLGLWKWLNFEPLKLAEDPARDVEWLRGRYIVLGPGHCGECHTPRNLLGGLDREAHLAGNPEGPDGESVPAIAPSDPDFARWSEADIVFALEIGMKPDGDFLGGSMGHVIENSTGKLRESDRKAIARYLKDPEESL